MGNAHPTPKIMQGLAKLKGPNFIPTFNIIPQGLCEPLTQWCPKVTQGFLEISADSLWDFRHLHTLSGSYYPNWY